LAIRPSEYHVLQKSVIRWANKNVPPSQKFVYRVNHFKPCANSFGATPKCTNSIKQFENSALQGLAFFWPQKTSCHRFYFSPASRKKGASAPKFSSRSFSQ
jgi:hypothetical protein